MEKPNLLVVDDEESIRNQLKYGLRDDFTLFFAEDRHAALAVIEEHHPQLVTLDLGLPPVPDGAEEGFKTLEHIVRRAPDTMVVVVTGNGGGINACRAMELGAFDYHSKPIDLAVLQVVLKRAAYLHELESDVERHLDAEESSARFEGILGATSAMREIFNTIVRVSKTNATVLIQGESGTGKELLARAIHSNSRRKSGPFIALNCGAIVDALLEAELFGHEKGAYTGAHIGRKGKVELAEGGTLFLDEIAEMSVALQAKLLRFLQERQIEHVGGRRTIRVDTRLIAATNKDLNAEMQAGRFREDLYYRISVVNLNVPPLRDRGEDIILLANAFLRKHAPRGGRRKLRFTDEALEAMTQYRWNGNVRELENAVQRAIIMARGGIVELSSLGIAVGVAHQESLQEARGHAERQAVIGALIKTRGKIGPAAKNLRVSPPTFRGLLQKFEVNARRFR